MLGIGRTGHIGFNEPGSSLASLTRVKTLTEQTRARQRALLRLARRGAAHCLTQGLGTILRARHLVLLAFGEAKARRSPAPSRAGDGVASRIGDPAAPARHRDRRRGGGVATAQRRLLPLRLGTELDFELRSASARPAPPVPRPAARLCPLRSTSREDLGTRAVHPHQVRDSARGLRHAARVRRRAGEGRCGGGEAAGWRRTSVAGQTGAGRRPRRA